MWKTKKILKAQANAFEKSFVFEGGAKFIVDYLPFLSFFRLLVLHFLLHLPVWFGVSIPLYSRAFVVFAGLLFSVSCWIILKYRYALRWGLVYYWYDWIMYSVQIILFCGWYLFWLRMVWIGGWRHFKPLLS